MRGRRVLLSVFLVEERLVEEHFDQAGDGARTRGEDLHAQLVRKRALRAS
jgi:hypothetical protein